MAELPPPSSWDEFEEIVWDLLFHEWDDPNTVRHGRQGQPQHGVDIYGRRNGCGRYIGAQCKLHSGPNRLTYQEVLDEVQKAEGFEPSLGELLIVTTSRRDVAVQRAVRLLSHERENEGQFAVHVRFWEDVRARIALDLGIARRHYPQFFAAMEFEERVGASNEVSVRASGLKRSSFHSGRLQVFVSSRIHAGLDEERLEVAGAVEGTGMARAWYWERDGYATPEGYREVCTRHVFVSDALVLILADQISTGIRIEYDAALDAGRPCYVFLKDGCKHEDDLHNFLSTQRTTITVRYFKNLSELRSHMVNALAAELAILWRAHWETGSGTSVTLAFRQELTS